jgi:hypothetical protein
MLSWISKGSTGSTSTWIKPRLQTSGGGAFVFKDHRGDKVALTTLMAPISHTFVHAIERFARD